MERLRVVSCGRTVENTAVVGTSERQIKKELCRTSLNMA